jgi:hypothetical protein
VEATVLVAVKTAIFYSTIPGAGRCAPLEDMPNLFLITQKPEKAQQIQIMFMLYCEVIKQV